MDFESAVKYLKSFSSYEDLGFPKYEEQNYGIKRVSDFLRSYKVNYDKLKYIHVAGSKGKGSVCNILANYLAKKNLIVGMFTTPYILDITECFWLSGKFISKSCFVEYVFELKKFIDKNGTKLTYFELLTVLVLKYFVDNNVNYAVIEVGLGGRLDATNVVLPKVAVITSLEKEHTEILGKTFSKILDEKLGIINGKSGINVVIGQQSHYIKNLIEEKINHMKTNFKEVVFVGKKSLNIDLIDGKGLTDVFIDNAKIAFEVLKLLVKEVDESLFIRILSETKIMARFDKKIIRGKEVIFDMAHTKNSIKALFSSLKRLYPKRNLVVLFGLLKGKNLKGIWKIIVDDLKTRGKIRNIIITSSHDVRGYTGEEIFKITGCDGGVCTVIEDKMKAFENVLSRTKKGDLAVITGSHFLISEILKNFL